MDSDVGLHPADRWAIPASSDCTMTKLLVTSTYTFPCLLTSKLFKLINNSYCNG